MVFEYKKGWGSNDGLSVINVKEIKTIQEVELQHNSTFKSRIERNDNIRSEVETVKLLNFPMEIFLP